MVDSEIFLANELLSIQLCWKDRSLMSSHFPDKHKLYSMDGNCEHVLQMIASTLHFKNKVKDLKLMLSRRQENISLGQQFRFFYGVMPGKYKLNFFLQ